MEIIILGSSNAVPRQGFENTHFAVEQSGRVVLVDCAGNPMIRLPEAGIAFEQIEDLVLTHFHPDHVSGAPLLLMGMWLLGRTKRLHLHGLAYTLDRLESMLKLYDYENWPDFYPLVWNRIPEQESVIVVEDDELRVHASPVDHLIPNIALRFESKRSGKTFAYSSDTGPADQVVQLAKGCDLLLHETSGESKGHSTAAQAGEIAARAGVPVLYLIHYPAQTEQFAQMLQEAHKTFPGKVELARDLMRIPI